MNYIVLDLEWNQSFGGSSREDPRMPFEIIEIGAVKIDENYNYIDEYSSIIKPRIYTRLQSNIRAILNYDEETLKKGRPFDIVCREFLKWCGDEYIFCTWGPLDLWHLQVNMDYYYMRKLPFPLKYYNIQQIYADLIDPKKSIVKLEYAVNNFNIPKTMDFHSAVNDAKYTAYVLQNINPRDIDDRYDIDYYNHPMSKDEEINAVHKTYAEFISKEYTDKTEAFEDKDINTLKCSVCNRKTSKKIKWFSNTNNSYMSAGRCWCHGYMYSKIKVKHTKNNKIFIIKTTSPSTRQKVNELKDKQIEIRTKKREKRNLKSQKKHSK